MTIAKMPPTSAETSHKPLLELPALLALRLDWEKIAWIVLILLSLVMRLYNIGARTMSHDESLHTTYSHHLYAGTGYKHDPLMHGPFLFELTAASYFLFGPSDASARLPVAIFGVALVGLMWFARRWLGRGGAFLAAVMLSISPALLYHSRYIRHDVYLVFFAVLTALLMFRYLEDGRDKWLLGLAAALGLAFTTMEASFIYAIIFVGFLLVWVVVKLLTQPWQQGNLKWPFLAMLGLGALLSIYPMVEAIKAEAGVFVTSARLGGLVMWPLFLAGLIILFGAFYLLFRGFGQERLRTMRELDVMMWMLTLAAPMYAAFPIKLFGGNPQEVQVVSNMLNAMVLRSAIVFFVMLILFAVMGVFWGGKRYLVGLAIFYSIVVLLFTTFFTNGNGIGTGLVGSVGYWLAQQQVRRGSQPWFYYFMLVPLYEFLPMLLSGLGAIAIIWRALRRRVIDPTGDGPENGAPAIRAEWLLFLVFWAAAVWGAFTWAGEKMPWLTTHLTTPLCILSGWYLAERLKLVDWMGIRQRRGLWLLGGIPLWLGALVVFIQISRRGPFRGSDVDGLSDSVGWIVALVVLVALGYLLVRKALEIEWPSVRRLAFLSLASILAIFTLRTTLLYNYVNYDYATEPMVYAHGTPDIKEVLGLLQDISRQTVGENNLAFAYDNETTWPLEWYFRDFPNKKFFGGTPSREYLKDAPVVLVGVENDEKVKPFLGNQYYRTEYKQIWWPKQRYMELWTTTPVTDASNQPLLDGKGQQIMKTGVNWELLRTWLQDPQARKNFWDVLLYRRYQQPLNEWDPSDRFAMYVRKDIANQVWDLGALPVAAAPAEVDPFEGKIKLAAATQIIGGQAGAAPGQMQNPRNMAVGPDGRMYVADTANHRIQVFDNGTFVLQWGSFGVAPGQFNEPWGIAIDKTGRVFVADTWNHRVQVFDANGKYLQSWGAFVSTDGQLGQDSVFWGPRAIAVDAEGNLLVTDAGNKRVQVFNADGGFIAQFGGGGVEPGFLDEPVGLAVGPDGSVYVADTWNRRIQKFSAGPDYQFVKEWPVPGWATEDIFNKPYVAVDSQGQVYVTDPTGWRVLVWDSVGNPKAALGQYGNGATDFALPNGIAIGPDDTVWVADADNHRVMQFEPVR